MLSTVQKSLGAVVFHSSEAAGMSVQLVRVRAFWAEMASRDGRGGIAFNGYQLPILVVDELAASDSAIRTENQSSR